MTKKTRSKEVRAPGALKVGEGKSHTTTQLEKAGAQHTPSNQELESL
jgi:hypothetical protein